jgi:hypothetical protein
LGETYDKEFVDKKTVIRSIVTNYEHFGFKDKDEAFKYVWSVEEVGGFNMGFKADEVIHVYKPRR